VWKAFAPEGNATSITGPDCTKVAASPRARNFRTALPAAVTAFVWQSSRVHWHLSSSSRLGSRSASLSAAKRPTRVVEPRRSFASSLPLCPTRVHGVGKAGVLNRPLPGTIRASCVSLIRWVSCWPPSLWYRSSTFRHAGRASNTSWRRKDFSSLLHSTHAHSALAVAAQASRNSVAIIEARRNGIIARPPRRPVASR